MSMHKDEAKTKQKHHDQKWTEQARSLLAPAKSDLSPVVEEIDPVHCTQLVRITFGYGAVLKIMRCYRYS